MRVQRAEIEEMEETLVKRAHRLEFKEVELAASREALQSAERRFVSEQERGCLRVSLPLIPSTVRSQGGKHKSTNGQQQTASARPSKTRSRRRVPVG